MFSAPNQCEFTSLSLSSNTRSISIEFRTRIRRSHILTISKSHPLMLTKNSKFCGLMAKSSMEEVKHVFLYRGYIENIYIYILGVI